MKTITLTGKNVASVHLLSGMAAEALLAYQSWLWHIFHFPANVDKLRVNSTQNVKNWYLGVYIYRCNHATISAF